MDLINIEPKSQTKLYNHSELFSEITNLYNKNKLPSKIIFSGQKGIGKSIFAYHLINYIFSKNENFEYDVKNFEINDSSKSYKLILNNSHPNFYLIDVNDDKKVIEISQIRKMIGYANKSAFNNKERIVLINNAENLNTYSANALLKIIEEPNDNLFFILIFDNSKKIPKTLKSRCLQFNFSLSFDECLDTANKIINNKIQDFINNDLIDRYNSIEDFIDLINFSITHQIDIENTDLKHFLINAINADRNKKKTNIKINIYKYIEFYLLKLISANSSNTKFHHLYDAIIKKIYYLKKFNLDEESFFIEIKTKILNG